MHFGFDFFALVLRKSGFAGLLLGACMATSAALPATADDAATSGMGDASQEASFFDPFDRVDSDFWYISDGWSNGSHQNCTWSQSMISAAAGVLSLRLEKDHGSHKLLCGEIQSRQAYGYGTYEARVKSATGSGLNSAFFSFIGPADHQEHDEIDFEILGKDLATVQINQYVKAKGGNEKLVALPGLADQGFNDLAFIWEPSRLRFFLNGKLVQDVTDPTLIPTARQKVFFSLWGTDTLSSWMGPFSYSGPASMQVDWVGFTAAGQHCLFAESLTCDPTISISLRDQAKESQR
jgi:endo-1,3-1,4-beta-glycanase ExoK